MSLSSPLDLRAHLKSPDLRFDAIPLVDALLIGLCLLALGSTFVSAPGQSVDLPLSDVSEPIPVVDVLTIKHDNMLLYAGRIFTLAEMQRFFESQYVDDEAREGMLLVKVNRDVSIQTFLTVCDAARVGGFERVQIASEPLPKNASPWQNPN